MARPVENGERPVVGVASRLPEEVLAPLLWGLEEEGIPFEVVSGNGLPGVSAARRAAEGSRLGVGVSVSSEVVIHHRDLPEGAPLFRVALSGLGAAGLRRMGVNAARLVKGAPLELSPDTAAGAEAVLSRLVEDVLHLVMERKP